MKTETKNEYYEYWQDVLGTASNLVDEVIDENLDYENALERLDQNVDNSQRVIYTYQAKQCMIHTDNEDAYQDDFGTEGMVNDSGINWSGLAYASFRADILERLSVEGYDINSPDRS